MKNRLGRPSPAMLVACLALFVALTGSAVAAGIAKNSVGTAQLKKNAVTGVKIKSSAVVGSDVKDDSLTGADVNESSLGTVPSAASAQSIATNSVDGSSIKDGSLTAKDVSRVSGTVTLDIGSVNANTCNEEILNTGTGADMKDDAIVVTPKSWSSGLTLHTENSNADGLIRLNVCNPTNGALDQGSTQYHFVAFDVD
jgi:hypothetical protein